MPDKKVTELYRKGRYSIRYCTYLPEAEVIYRNIEVCINTGWDNTVYTICSPKEVDDEFIPGELNIGVLSEISDMEDLMDLKATLKVYALMLQGERIYD